LRDDDGQKAERGSRAVPLRLHGSRTIPQLHAASRRTAAATARPRKHEWVTIHERMRCRDCE
jgi:hypothetical protein